MSVKYINNKQELGIDYDWNYIKREVNKVGIPSWVYNPTDLPLHSHKYFINMSERSAGKTTNWLILGMVMFQLYGTVIQYIRQTSEMIAPKNMDIFNTILEYDYISKITNNEYNNVYYKSRRYYFSHVDEVGNVDKVSNDYFMYCASIDKGQDLKSSYNAPKGDLIIFDEFVSKIYYPNEFVDFCDLVKTIIRDRQSPIIVMLANTIDRHNQYFNELEIYDDVQQLKQGEHKSIITDRGTRIYIELLGIKEERKKKLSIVNKLFFGFKNPQLSSITGEDWAIKNYQHIPNDNKEVHNISSKIYIYHNSKYIRLDIVTHEVLGVCLYVHWATRTYPDSIILTCEDRLDNRYIFKFGNNTLNQFLNKMLKEKRIYFATNDVGSFFDNYVRYCSKLQY